MTIEELVVRVDHELEKMVEEKHTGEPKAEVLQRYRTIFINRYIDNMAKKADKSSEK